MNDGTSRVLATLRDAASRTPGGAQCSGQLLSAELGVSRAAVWKHVQALRERGYEIEGAAGGGYALTGLPDRLYPEEIEAGRTTRWLASTVHYHDEIDSTNRLAFELGRDGAAAGTTVIAERQTAGRGRLGRSFFSPAYRNLYTSVVLRPELTIAEAPTLILSSAIAVAEAVAESITERTGSAETLEIKWPNDVLIGGLKTSGILMEMSAEATRVGFAVLGIGVNLNVEREEFPDEFRDRATSLRVATGARVERTAFACRLYGILEDVLDQHAEQGFAGLRERFDRWFRMSGQAIEVHGMTGSSLHGVARGVAPDGGLEVERADGSLERVIAGDVTLRGPSGASQ
jgi:BirA family biotin operon repressor/biotin-[acetyl-CoA-carboxylase] ligase